MSKFIEIQSSILSLGPGEYQRLCSTYAIQKYNLNNMHDIGSKEGTNKTTIGIPDSYSVDDNGKYILLMYGTVEKKSVSKLTTDIIDAANGKKTGLIKKQIKEIICFHTNTNIKPGEYNKLVNLIPDIKITLIDIDSLAHDIDENYHNIANDYLNIPIDTNQISDINTFIERYDKNSINAPLNIDFVYRKDKDTIYKNALDSKMTIVTGKPGTGKTKISLEVLKELEKNENYSSLCIRINGLELYNDIKTAIKNDKNYIIFFDDINNLNGLMSVVDLIVTNKNENIKILATVRDYLLDEVLKKLNLLIEPSVCILNKMNDSEIINILENTYNVKNKEWQQKILKISNGNPRLAIMSFISVRDGKIDSLNSVYDIFKNYYDNVINYKKLSDYEIKVLFYIALLSPISTSNEIVSNYLKELEIFNIETFKKLRDMELIDYFNDDALKICDQNFSNYLVYKYLIIDKTINISNLLKQVYPNFINKFINVINMINEQFYDANTLNYITQEIDTVWNEEPYNSDWKFVDYFHNVNVSKALLKIKNKIESYAKEEMPEEIKYKNNAYLSDNLLSLISDFKDTEYLKLSFELLLSYLEKRPSLYNEICKSIKDYWLITNPYPDFLLETEIINVLFSKYKTTTIIKMREIYKILLEQSLLYCLELEFHISKQGNTPRTINFITIKLQENDKIFSFRKHLYDIVFQLCNEDETNYNILLNESIWFYDEDQKAILENDIKYLDEKFFVTWDNISIIQGKILFLLKEKCQKLNIEPPTSLEKYKECPEFLIINMFEKYDYDEKNDELLCYLENKSQDCYNTIFLILKKVEEYNINVDSWKIHNSLDLLFKQVLEKDTTLFEEIFILYLESDCPFTNGLFFIRNLVDKNILEKTLDNIIKSSTSKKHYLLSCILNNYYDEKYMLVVKDFIKNQKTMNKYTLSIEAIFEYSKYNEDLLENYTKDILTENDFGLYSSFTNSFVDKEFVETIYNAFDNKKTLEELYLKSIKCHSDYNGNMGFLLCINNYDFLNKILETESYDHTGKIRNIVKSIWKHAKHKDIISYNYDKIVESNFGYLRLHRLFDFDNEENIKKNQLEWFKEKILEIKEDKDKIYYLFYVIGDKENCLKKELILFLLDNTSNIEIFKQISFFSHSESWSGSRIPNIERKIEFIQSILSEIKAKNDLIYMEHIEYLNERIKLYKKEIKRTQIEEYIDDFLN